MLSDQIQQWARFCKEAGLTVFFGSPGSRSAPLVLALVRLGGFRIEMVMDERSAAFQALGYAMATGKPVGIFCTSGSAVLNYGPAIAEAYYQEIPLFVFTADRPAEWIDQHEGQAIRQRDIFIQHTRFSAELPTTENAPQALNQSLRLLQQALSYADGPTKGPVHLNIPLREPLYPAPGESDVLEMKSPRLVRRVNAEKKLPREELSRLMEIWQKTEKRMVLVGQHTAEADLANHARALFEYSRIPVCGDLSHNLHKAGLDHLALSHDTYSPGFWENAEHAPDLLITIGKGLISKAFRGLFSRFPPAMHWHIEVSDVHPADPFFSMTDWICCDPAWFIGKIAEGSYFGNSTDSLQRSRYQNAWKEAETQARIKLRNLAGLKEWSDYTAVHSMIAHFPARAGIFYGNSMAIRYGCWLGAHHQPEQTIWCNRGTSGIDGCLSTAVGIALGRPEEMLILVLGDMSFQYDRNGLWKNELPPNLKIIILNNAGGNIFRILPGSGNMPELEAYFELNQTRTAEQEAQAAGIRYRKVQSLDELQLAMPGFLESGCQVLECFTNKETNALQVKAWKQALK